MLYDDQPRQLQIRTARKLRTQRGRLAQLSRRAEAVSLFRESTAVPGLLVPAPWVPGVQLSCLSWPGCRPVLDFHLSMARPG